jgi:NAD(P)-dependent dehydrogenase (short-subunit alcohol dehydrogenase family)
MIAVVVGSSRGTGLEIAKVLAGEGYDLALSEIHERFETLLQEAKNIEEVYNVTVRCYKLDINYVADIEKVFKDIEKDFSNIDVLVNNAGINILMPSLEMTEEIWDKVVDVNLKGLFFTMKEAAKIMLKNNGGAIVNMASQHGIVGNENRAPYCSSKAGLVNLTKALSYEWAKYDIRVNAISPTYVLLDENEELLLSSKGRKQYLNYIPLRKYCTKEHIASAVKYLVSGSSSIITGHNLVLDGGYTAV